MENNFDIQKLAKSSRRSAVASLLGVIVVAASLVYSGFTLANLQREREKLQKEKESLIQSNKQLQDSINTKQTQLNLAMALAEHRHELDWTDAKILASNYQTFKLVDDLFRLRAQGVPWKLGGTSPQTGFDSPSFAAYVLSQRNTNPRIEFSMRYQLRDKVPATNDPQPGDLIFYDTGYAMFYLRDHHGNKFCIGMTPMGIVSLDINFGPTLLGYGKIEYMH